MQSMYYRVVTMGRAAIGWACAALLCAGLTVAPQAAAQTTDDTVALLSNCAASANCAARFPGILPAQIYTTLEDAIIAANDAALTIVTLIIDQDATAWAVTDATAPPPISEDLVVRGVVDNGDTVTPVVFTPINIIIDSALTGGASSAVFEVDDGVRLTLEGITVENSSGTPRDGVLVKSGGEAIINRVFFKAFRYGVRVMDGQALVTNCGFKDNEDGMNVDTDGKARVFFSAFRDSTGAGIIADNNAEVSVSNSVFADGAKGLEEANGGDITTDYNYFWMNTTDLDGPTAGANDYPPLVSATGPDPDFISEWGEVTANSSGLAENGNENFLSESLGPVSISGISLGTLLSADFELKVRPDQSVTPRPYIGPDEALSAAAAVGAWYECRITPFGGASGDPVGLNFQTTLEVTVGGATGTVRAFFVPQSGDDTAGVDWLEVQNLNRIGGGLYRGSFIIDSGILENDLVADGHARIQVTAGGTSPTVGTPTPEGQAETGRHFLIDTIAPRIFIESYFLEARADDLVFYDDDIPVPPPFSAVNAPIAPLGTHPYPNLPNDWAPAAFNNPVDQGPIDIFLRPTLPDDRKGAKAFFNYGSEANFYNPDFVVYPLDNLQIKVQVRMLDSTPINTDGLPLTNADSLFPALTSLGASGFRSEDDGGASVTAGTVIAGLPAVDPESLQVTWLPAAGTASPGGFMTYDYDFAQASAIDPSGTVQDVERYDPFDGVITVLNDALECTWTFVDALNNPGIQWNGSPRHLAMRFVARDLAGNITSVNTALDPLHVYWRRNLKSELLPAVDGATLTRFNFKYRLAEPPLGSGIPQQLFTYRFWTSDTANGLYAPVGTSWATWSSETTLISDNPTQLVPGGGDQFVILAITGADEAGNVEDWPPNGLVTANSLGNPTIGGDHLLLSGGGDSRWQQFFLSTQIAPDTAITPTYWWNRYAQEGAPRSVDDTVSNDERNFGAQNILPSPTGIAPGTTERLEARFKIDVTDIPNVDLNLLKVQWALTENDATTQRSIQGVLPWGEFVQLGLDTQVFALAAPIINGNRPNIDDGAPDPDRSNRDLFGRLDWDSANDSTPFTGLGDPRRRAAFSYVFHAAVFIDDGAGANRDNNVLDADELADPTPASVQFTVAPEPTVGNYIAPEDEADDQPIKSRETL
jgi:hypothetical protein